MSANTLRLELQLNSQRAAAAMRKFTGDASRGLDNASRSARKFTDGATQGFNRLSSSAQRLTRSFNGLSRATSLFMAAGGMLAARQILTGMNELERAMLRVESNMVGGAKSAEDLHRQLQAVRDTARQLSKMTVFGDAAMADVTNQLLKSGMKQGDVIGNGGAAMAAAGLAQLGGVTPDVAAAALGSTANAFGMDGKRLYDFANHIVKADDASGINSGQILYNWQQANATGALMHIEPKKMISALAYSDTLMNEGGTALNRFLENLSAPTRQKHKYMVKSGMGFWNKDKQGNVELKNPDEIFDIIRKRYSGMKDKHAMLVELHKIFGEEGGRLAALAISKPESFSEFDKKVSESTGMQEKLAIQARGLSAAFERLKNSALSSVDNEFASTRDKVTAGTDALTSIIDKGQGSELLGAGAGVLGLAGLALMNKKNKQKAVAAMAEKASKLDRLAESARIQKVFVTNWPTSMLSPGEKIRGKLNPDGTPDLSPDSKSGKLSRMDKLGRGLAAVGAATAGYEFGTEVVAPLIDTIVESVTHKEGASLGTAIYDLLNRSAIENRITLDVALPEGLRVTKMNSPDDRAKINVDSGPIMTNAR